MQQERLFRLAPEVVSIQAVFAPGQGWTLTVLMRRQGELWDDAYRMQYSHLSTSELLDVVCEEAGATLGFA